MYDASEYLHCKTFKFCCKVTSCTEQRSSYNVGTVPLGFDR